MSAQVEVAVSYPDVILSGRWQKVRSARGMLTADCHLLSSTFVYLPSSGFAEERVEQRLQPWRK